MSEGGPGQSTLSTYSTEENVWQSVSVVGGPFNNNDRHWSMHASSSDAGKSLSFISGGMDYMRGMVIFNSSDPLNPSWANVTDAETPFFLGRFDRICQIRLGWRLGIGWWLYHRIIAKPSRSAA